jgi:hypothetical protein
LGHNKTVDVDVDVDSAPESLVGVDVGIAVDITKVHAASISRVEAA